MMNQKIIAIGLCAAFLMQNALACSQLPPEGSFIFENDKNKDGKLSKKEWQNADVKGYFVEMRVGDAKEFARLDTNKNGFISHQELNDKVRYRRMPCADWEEKMHQMMQEQQENSAK